MIIYVNTKSNKLAKINNKFTYLIIYKLKLNNNLHKACKKSMPKYEKYYERMIDHDKANLTAILICNYHN